MPPYTHFSALALLLCAACQAGPKRPGGKIVIEYIAPLADSVKVETPASLIQTAALTPPRATAPAGGTCPHPFCNASRNSRLPAAAGLTPRVLRWQAPLAGRWTPQFVTQDGDRVLVQGEGFWQLFDLAAKSVASGRYSAGNLFMDAPHGLFYGIGLDGYVCAWKLQDGARSFVFPSAYGDSYDKTFLARAGDRFIIVEAKAEPPGGSSGSGADSAVEAQVLAEPVRVDPQTARLLSARDLGQLRIPSRTIAAALYGSTVAFANPGRICYATTDLKLRGCLEGGFVPRALSVDEGGRVYMLHGDTLWAVAPDGRRFIDFRLPPGFESSSMPPVVGYNHRVYLAAPGGVAAVDLSGKQVWSAALPVAGAAVTPDDLVVVASGTTLAAFNPKGERTVLFTAPAPLATPPAMAASGDILVATSQGLLCLGK
ncbi:MAG: PQQ-binding-like beta-propeller repeat protein [Bryobacteraceae bacterium]